MSPASHLFISWCIANIGKRDRRERLLITLSGVIADVDGIGILLMGLRQYNQQALALWSRFHHTFGHTLLYGILFGLAILPFVRRKTTVLLLSLFCFHVHLFCDLIGSRGPDGYQWPIPYLWPMTSRLQITWNGQWELNAWPNFLITIAAVVCTLYLAWRRGYGILELISRKIDRRVVSALRARFGNPPNH